MTSPAAATARRQPLSEVVIEGECTSAVQTCSEHLAMLSTGWSKAADSPLNCHIDWQLDARAPGAATEATIQAQTGLMHVNGRDRGWPRRLGLEVASVCAGILGAQAAMAGLIARRRGLDVRFASTTVLQGGLSFLQHHVALATCGDTLPPPPTEGVGTPLLTSDGLWLEIESLSLDNWIRFWRLVGVERGLEDSWTGFVFRFLLGRCRIPEEMQKAAARRTYGEIAAFAKETGVAVCPVRPYSEVLGGSLPSAPWSFEWGRPEAASAKAPLVTQLPLSGLRVVEAGSRLQGPLAALMLHLLGAEVTKIEPPGGDFGRYGRPRAGNVGAAYLAYNRGKSPVELDLKSPSHRGDLLDLVATADVFLHNWRPGRAENLGLDFRNLVAAAPGIVYVEATGWGPEVGPITDFATDYLVQAYTGCAHGLTPVTEQPVPSLVPITDITGGMLACEGALAGLYSRELSGRGCQVTTSLVSAAVTLQASVMRDMAAGTESDRRAGRPLWNHADQALETAEGLLLLDADLAAAGVARQELKTRTALDWQRMFTQAGLPAAVINEDLSLLPFDRRVGPALEPVNSACWAPAAPWRFLS